MVAILVMCLLLFFQFIMAAEFHWADYFIMTLMLLASMATGAYFARYGMKSRTVEEYLLAGRKMHVVPVAFSTFVT